jgi:SAM-dependent methyltransferase
VNCPLCCKKESSPYASWSDFSVLQCHACGFRFVDTTDAKYPRDAQYVYDEPGDSCINPNQPHIQRRLKDIVRFKKPPASALDIGCGKGEVSIALSREGFDCAGLDMKERLITNLKRDASNVRWICASIDDMINSYEKFDLITLYHVLEHVSNPAKFLKDVLRLANRGALLVLEVPNVGGLGARWKGPRWHYYKVDHVSYFRASDLCGLLSSLGLHILAVRGYQHFSYPQNVLWKDLVKGLFGRIGFKDVISVFSQVQQ